MSNLWQGADLLLTEMKVWKRKLEDHRERKRAHLFIGKGTKECLERWCGSQGRVGRGRRGPVKKQLVESLREPPGQTATTSIDPPPSVWWWGWDPCRSAGWAVRRTRWCRAGESRDEPGSSHHSRDLIPVPVFNQVKMFRESSQLSPLTFQI